MDDKRVRKKTKVPRNFVAAGASMRKWGSGIHADKRTKRSKNPRNKKQQGWDDE